MYIQSNKALFDEMEQIKKDLQKKLDAALESLSFVQVIIQNDQEITSEDLKKCRDTLMKAKGQLANPVIKFYEIQEWWKKVTDYIAENEKVAD